MMGDYVERWDPPEATRKIRFAVRPRTPFSLERHFIDRQAFKERRSAALAKWQALAS
jgi:hypothetical protein